MTGQAGGTWAEYREQPRVKLLRGHRRVVAMNPYFQPLRGRQGSVGLSTPITLRFKNSERWIYLPRVTQYINSRIRGDNRGLLTPSSGLVILRCDDHKRRSSWSRCLISTGVWEKGRDLLSPWGQRKKER